jgi:hypothetical protein
MLPKVKSRRIPYTRHNHCPICDGDHKCSVGEDGLHMCGRTSGPVQGFKYLGKCKGDDQFSLYRREDDHRLQDDGYWNGHRPSPARTVKSKIDWPSVSRRYEQQITDDLRRELAATLGLPAYAICYLPVGYAISQDCWTFPECDGAGKVIGINRRFRNGDKRFLPGGNRGLTIADDWYKLDGPLFLPEGASDTLALRVYGRAGVGRPSNLGGVEQLAVLLRGVPKERQIIVMGENDQKPDGKWPGRDGAVQTADRLAGLLHRPVQWKLPPTGAKDSREWCVKMLKLPEW